MEEQELNSDTWNRTDSEYKIYRHMTNKDIFFYFFSQPSIQIKWDWADPVLTEEQKSFKEKVVMEANTQFRAWKWLFATATNSRG